MNSRFLLENPIEITQIPRLMSVHAIDLVSPAGSLTAGFYALRAGADAVYFGLERFSARQAAKNLTMAEVRRLKGCAEAVGGRIYAAVNTVIAEDEREDIIARVPELMLSGVDGLIVQDLGLASWLKDRYPDLPLHGSTQLAVHNRLGLETAARLGFRRVVLSRELAVEEIAALRAVAPEVTREVFVHGALCFGFSGLCLASAALTGRSGNRGSCAQICRSWFDGPAGKGYYFSLSDLDAGELLDQLAAAGVGALKIEGRLKSLAYVDGTTRYYRALLDGDEDKAAYYRDKSALAFSRPKSFGFLKSQGRLTQPGYPSHAGIPGAEVIAGGRHEITIRALTDLSAHDRLFRVPKAPPDEGQTLPLLDFWIQGKKRRSLPKDRVAVLKGVSGIPKGAVLMKTLSHDMHLKDLSKEIYAPFKTALPLYVEVREDGLKLGTACLGQHIETHYPVAVSERRGGRPFDEVLRDRFAASKGYAFAFDAPSAFPGMDRVPDDVFVPPSALKAVRKQFYQYVREALASDQDTASQPTDIAAISPRSRELPFPRLPARSEIRYRDGFPFLTESDSTPIHAWPLIEGVRFLALPPVVFHPDETVSRLEERISSYDGLIGVGLNNIGHLALVDRWSRYPHVAFFVDYGMYTANLWTVRFLKHRIPRLLGGYLWLEATPSQHRALATGLENATKDMNGTPFREIDCPDRFPLFISRVCANGFNGRRRCDSGCTGHFTMPLRQNDRHFRVVVEACMTYLFLTSPESSASGDPAKSGG